MLSSKINPILATVCYFGNHNQVEGIYCILARRLIFIHRVLPFQAYYLFRPITKRSPSSHETIASISVCPHALVLLPPPRADQVLPVQPHPRSAKDHTGEEEEGQRGWQAGKQV